MKPIRDWISARPYTAILLAGIFGITATAAALRDDWFVYAFGVFCGALLAMVFSMWKFTGPLVILCIALALPAKAAEPEFEPAGMVGVAVVVVVVGGVAVYLLARTCQRLFPKTPTPSTNEPPYFVPGALPDCAGSWTYSGYASCYEPFFNPTPTVNLELSGTVEINGDLRLSAGRRLTSGELLSPLEFQSDLAKHGITFGEIGVKSYGLWGKRAYPEEIPIAFSEDASGNKMVTINSTNPMRTVALERSSDLMQWKQIAKTSVPIGQRIRIVDSTTSGQMFYRLQLIP